MVGVLSYNQAVGQWVELLGIYLLLGREGSGLGPEAKDCLLLESPGGTKPQVQGVRLHHDICLRAHEVSGQEHW